MAINDTLAAILNFVNTDLTIPLNTLINNTKTAITSHVTSSINTLTTKVNALQTESNALTRYNNVISNIKNNRPSLTGTGKTAYTRTGAVNPGHTMARFIAPVDGLYKVTCTCTNSESRKGLIYKMLENAYTFNSSGNPVVPQVSYAYSLSVNSGDFSTKDTPCAYICNINDGTGYFYARGGELVVLFMDDADYIMNVTITITYQQQ